LVLINNIDTLLND